MDERKFFLCSGVVAPESELWKHDGAHILGHLTYLSDEGRKVTGLALWERSEPTDRVPPISPEIRVYLVGDARMVRCALCERKERWEIGKAAFLALMEKYYERRHGK